MMQVIRQLLPFWTRGEQNTKPQSPAEDAARSSSPLNSIQDVFSFNTAHDAIHAWSTLPKARRKNRQSWPGRVATACKRRIRFTKEVVPKKLNVLGWDVKPRQVGVETSPESLAIEVTATRELPNNTDVMLQSASALNTWKRAAFVKDATVTGVWLNSTKTAKVRLDLETDLRTCTRATTETTVQLPVARNPQLSATIGGDVCGGGLSIGLAYDLPWSAGTRYAIRCFQAEGFGRQITMQSENRLGRCFRLTSGYNLMKSPGWRAQDEITLGIVRLSCPQKENKDEKSAAVVHAYDGGQLERAADSTASAGRYVEKCGARMDEDQKVGGACVQGGDQSRNGRDNVEAEIWEIRGSLKVGRGWKVGLHLL